MKPGDFLLGVLDFFAILLPGGLTTWLVTQYIPPDDLRRVLSFGLGDGTTTPDAIVLGAAFLFASYTLGHFVFMIGGRLDPLYDRWRRHHKSTEKDKVFQAAHELKRRLTPKMLGGDFTTLKWTRAYIQVRAPAARTEIDRLEADSKFFRSLVVVWLALAVHFLLREQALIVTLVVLVLSYLSYSRFRQQRWKMTELSYATAVIVDATMPLSPSAADALHAPSSPAEDA